jgi:hypothetical protein
MVKMYSSTIRIISFCFVSGYSTLIRKKGRMSLISTTKGRGQALICETWNLQNVREANNRSDFLKVNIKREEK